LVEDKDSEIPEDYKNISELLRHIVEKATQQQSPKGKLSSSPFF
jgi:hypothetical protein